MSNGQRVLVVDGLSEVQEVLQAVLEPRGLRVDWVRSHVQAHHSGDSERPDVVVFDAEAVPLTAEHPNGWSNVPQVILGSETAAAPLRSPSSVERHFLGKPFQYSELIQAIEQLLPRRGGDES